MRKYNFQTKLKANLFNWVSLSMKALHFRSEHGSYVTSMSWCTCVYEYICSVLQKNGKTDSEFAVITEFSTIHRTQ